ncbi:MAG: hypothetical protein BIFFINMI_02113 [Phycisphaerae bacterium]|nr:hypothetical protein [Phycisphaerae bacterium]
MRHILSVLMGATLAAGLAARCEGAVRFTQPPAVRVQDDALRIEFAVSEVTDVSVAIVGADRKVVRHLAAGKLGANPPAPLAADSLRQSLPWDRLDDDGRRVEGKCQARVSIGLGASLDRIYGWDDSYALDNSAESGPSGLAVTPAGEVIAYCGGHRNGPRIVAFSREGKYLRTLCPYSGDLPEEKVAGFGRLKLKDGGTLPITYLGHNGVVLQEVFNPERQTMVVSPQGWLVFPNSVANGDWYGIQTDRRRVLVMGTDGSCPRKTFLGPTILAQPKAGEAHLAVSPDGKYVYASGFGEKNRPEKPQLSKPVHAVYRGLLDSTDACAVLVGDPAKPGADDFHFKGPAGLAVDARGNLYVADSGNNRIMVYDADGKKLLAKASIEGPDQLQINPETGDLYVLSFPANAKQATLTKLGPLPDMKVLASNTFNRFPMVAPVFALDANASPPILWVSRLAWHDPGLTAVQDRGNELVFMDREKLSIGYQHPTERLVTTKGAMFQSWPGLIAVDPKEEVLYAGFIDWSRIDLASGRVSRSSLKAYDLTFAPDGTLYSVGHTGYRDSSVWRHDRDGKRIAFPDGSMEFKAGPTEYRVGSRGFAVDRKGDIYLAEVFDRTKLNNGTRISHYGPSGKPVNLDLVKLPVSAGGFQVDRRGNVYVVCNVRPRGVVYPDAFAKQDCLPDPLSLPHPWDWPYAYLNYYLFHIGSVFRFGPDGGSIQVNWDDHDVKSVPEGSLAGGKVPPRQVSGIHYHTVDVKGATMQYFGISPTSSPAVGGRDPYCLCWSPRFAADDFGRLFLPDTLRFQLAVVDASGNEILRFGRYGNPDQRGPEIAFEYFMYVVKVNDSLYVSDYGNQRILKIRLSHQAESTAEIP